MLHVACRMPHVACRMSHVGMLQLVRRFAPVLVCRHATLRMLDVACRMLLFLGRAPIEQQGALLHVACRMSHVAFSHVACLMLHVLEINARMSHVSCRMITIYPAGFKAIDVAGNRHVACRMSHLARRMSHVACRML